MNKNNEFSSFSEAFKELESLTKEFEEGQISLEEGVPKFERGVRLSNFCKSKLAEVENRIHEVKYRLNDTDQSSSQT